MRMYQSAAVVMVVLGLGTPPLGIAQETLTFADDAHQDYGTSGKRRTQLWIVLCSAQHVTKTHVVQLRLECAQA